MFKNRTTGIVPICLSPNRRYFSTSGSHPELPGTPRPILTIDLDYHASLIQYENLLKGKGGIYSIVNTVNGKQYALRTS